LKLSRDGEGVDFREGSGDPIGEQTTTGSWACAGRFWIWDDKVRFLTTFS